MTIKDQNYINLINKSLKDVINNSGILQSKLSDSMKYSLFSGGKRLRPLLCLKTYELFGGTIDNIMPFAISIELIHTYSLIHDDLPAMDNDDFRRGKPTNHRVFGQGFAILSGDALLNLAFENMLQASIDKCYTVEEYERYIKAMFEIGKYSGSSGMIGGQAIDLVNKFESKSDYSLISMYRAKTAALIEAAVVSGAIVGQAKEDEIEALRKFSTNLGLAYQIRDDILDYDEDKDINKCTYLSYHNKEDASEEIHRLSSEAIDFLNELKGKDVSYFIDLTNKLAIRQG